jgi:flagellar hook assembly protein FlgD
VGSDLTLKVQNLVNYPNPFKDDTQFTFELTQSAEAEIKIYTVAGRLIRTLRPGILPAGYNQVYWDGKDADGDGLANGVYLYKITAKAAKPGSSGTASEITAKEFGRLVVMR